jgi:hypothetical protein
MARRREDILKMLASEINYDEGDDDEENVCLARGPAILDGEDADEDNLHIASSRAIEYDEIPIIGSQVPLEETESEAEAVDDTTSQYSSSETTSNENTDSQAADAISGGMGDDDHEEQLSEIEEDAEHEDGSDDLSLIPKPHKPIFQTLKLSPMASMLPEFLSKLEAANNELEAERAAGTLSSRRIEIDESEDATQNGQYIEMNLGLGVLKEKTGDSSTSSNTDSDADDDDKPADRIMDKLMGQRSESKKVVIEEL